MLKKLRTVVNSLSRQSKEIGLCSLSVQQNGLLFASRHPEGPVARVLLKGQRLYNASVWYFLRSDKVVERVQIA
jgi:hypothetical protein